MPNIFQSTAGLAQDAFDASLLPQLERACVECDVGIALTGTTNVFDAIQMLRNTLDSLPPEARETARLVVDYESDRYDPGGWTTTQIVYDRPESDAEHFERRFKAYHKQRRIDAEHAREVEKAVELLRSLGKRVED